MKIATSKAIAKAAAKRMALAPPLIPFDHPKKGRGTNRNKKDRRKKQSEDEDDSTTYVSFDVRLIPGDDDSPKVRRKLRVFEDGTPEEWCKWRIDLEGLTLSVATYARNDAKVSVINTLLREGP